MIHLGEVKQREEESTPYSFPFGENENSNESKTVEIDLVITYVNGSDEEFQRQLTLAKAKHSGSIPPFSASRNRFTDNDDLRFLLRSVDVFGAIFRRIFLVVADERHVPRWLNTSNERVQVVFHRNIWRNQSNLPTFNSLAIEANLHHIDGLAELYVYANDDVAFLALVVADDFFQLAADGRKVLSFTKRSSAYSSYSLRGVQQKDKSAHYFNPAVNSRALILKEEVCAKHMLSIRKFSQISRRGSKEDQRTESYKDFVDLMRFPQHVPHAFVRSVLERAERIAVVREAFEKTWRSRLRSGREVNVVHFFANFAQCAERIRVKGGKENEVLFLHLGQPIASQERYERLVDELMASTGKVFDRNTTEPLKYACVNDETGDSVDEGSLSSSYSRIIRLWRETLFPRKSNFELE